MKRGWSGVFVAAIVAVAACGDLSVDPDEVTAIVFDELPSTSIVAGDTLRDFTGAVAPLMARLFDAEGAKIVDKLVAKTRGGNVSVIWDHVLDEVLGDASGVNAVRVKHKLTGATRDPFQLG